MLLVQWLDEHVVGLTKGYLFDACRVLGDQETVLGDTPILANAGTAMPPGPHSIQHWITTGGRSLVP